MTPLNCLVIVVAQVKTVPYDLCISNVNGIQHPMTLYECPTQVKTAPYDPRFPATNQARNCYTRYNEFYKCAACTL